MFDFGYGLSETPLAEMKRMMSEKDAEVEEFVRVYQQ